jgi:hypothetical protein
MKQKRCYSVIYKVKGPEEDYNEVIVIAKDISKAIKKFKENEIDYEYIVNITLTESDVIL